jgi:hypothetical protein
MFNWTLEKNLVLTGLFGKLLSHPDPRLRHFLFSSGEVEGDVFAAAPKVRNLRVILATLWQSAFEGLAQFPDKERRLARSRERLFSSDQSNEFNLSNYNDRESDRRFFEACVILEEFTKEVVSSLEVGKWMVGDYIEKLKKGK